MKKILLVWLALSFCFLMPSALADDLWKIGYDGSIMDYLGSDTVVTVPGEIDGTQYFTTYCSFWNNETVTEISFSEGIRILGISTVYSNPELTAVHLPEGLEVIDDNFIFCDKLESLTIPASVHTVGFICDSVASLKSVTYEGAVPYFNQYSMSNTEPDLVIYVPDDQLSAYRAALDPELNIQPSGKNAVVVEYTTSEADFEIDADGIITAYHGSDTWIKVPASVGGIAVKGIGPEVFASNRVAYRYSLPEGLESIGSKAFWNTTTASQIELPSTLKTIGSEAFYSCGVDSLNIPDSVETIGPEAFCYCNLTDDFRIPSAMSSVGERAFYGAYNIETLTIPASVVSIGKEAFQNNYSMELIALETTELPELGENALAPYLTDVDLPSDTPKSEAQKLKAIFQDMGYEDVYVWRQQNPDVEYAVGSTYENHLFTGYTGTQTAIRPYDFYDYTEPVTGIADGALKGNTVVTYFSVPYNDVFVSIGAEAFADSVLEKIDLFDSVETIGDSAFRGCKALTEITLPDSVKSIGSNAFADTGITVLELPARVTLAEGALNGIPEEAVTWRESAEETACPYPATSADDFYIDSNFNRLDHYIGNEVNLVLPSEKDGVALTMLSANTFERARSTYGEVKLPVKSVVIPDSYTEIVYGAFADMPDLEVVICYAPLERLGAGVFSNCPKLHTVLFVNGLDTLTEYDFSECGALTTLYVGSNTEGSGLSAFESILCTELPEDIDAILAAAQGDPVVPPEDPSSENPVMPEDLLIPDDTTAAAFMGTWQCVSMNVDGMEFNPSIMGYEISYTFMENGKASVSNNGDDDDQVWYIYNDALYCGYGVPADDMRMELQEDGSLFLFMEGTSATFTRDGSPAAALDYLTGPEADPWLGTWQADTLESSGYSFDLATFGSSFQLILEENGKASMDSDGEIMNGFWYRSDDRFYFSSMEIILNEDGSLTLDMADSKLHFNKVQGPEPSAESGDITPYLGTWYGISMNISGREMNLAALGMDIQLVLNENGIARIVTNGVPEENAWYFSDGVLYIRGNDSVSNMELALSEENTLLLSQDGSVATFSRESASAGQGIPTGAEAEPWLGIWQASEMIMENVSINLTSLGSDISLTLNEDGTGALAENGETLPGLWYQTGNQFFFSGNEMQLENDTLLLDLGGQTLLFTRSDAEPEKVIDNERIQPYIDHWYALNMNLTVNDTEFFRSTVYDALDFEEDGIVWADTIDGTHLPFNWYFLGDRFYISNGEDDFEMIPQEDGSLLLYRNDMDYTYFFPSWMIEPEPEIVTGEEAEPWLGTWEAVQKTVGKSKINLKSFGTVIILTLDEYGTGILDSNGKITYDDWYRTGDQYFYGEHEMYLEEETLVLTGPNQSIIFTRMSPRVVDNDLIQTYLGDWFTMHQSLTEIGTILLPSSEYLSLEFEEDGIVWLETIDEYLMFDWYFQDGQLYITDENLTFEVIPQFDGGLQLHSGNYDSMVFYPEWTYETLSEEESEPWLGLWNAIGGSDNLSLLLEEDGFAAVITEDAENDCRWYRQWNRFYLDGNEMILSEDTLILTASENSLVFIRPSDKEIDNEKILPYMQHWIGLSMNVAVNGNDQTDESQIVSLDIQEDGIIWVDTLSQTHQKYSWYFHEDTLYISDGEHDFELLLQPDGSLLLFRSKIDYTYFFPSDILEPEHEILTGEEAEPWLDTWVGFEMITNGKALKLASLNSYATLTLAEDGYACLDIDYKVTEGSWYRSEDRYYMDGSELTLTGDTLTLDEKDYQLTFIHSISENELIQPYIGVWYASSILSAEYGCEIPLIALGSAESTIEFLEDGVLVMNDEGYTFNSDWFFDKETLYIRALDDCHPVSLDENGALKETLASGEICIYRKNPPSLEDLDILTGPEAEPWLGTWLADDADETSAYSLTLSEDGQGTYVESDGTEMNALWYRVDDTMFFFAFRITLETDTLTMDTDAGTFVFTKEIAGTDEPLTDAGTDNSIVGQWTGISMVISGRNVDLESIGYQSSLDIREDGTVSRWTFEKEQKTLWYPDHGVLYLGDGNPQTDAVMEQKEDGTLWVSDSVSAIVYKREGAPAPSVTVSEQKPEPDPSAAETKDDPTTQALAGHWTAKQMRIGPALLDLASANSDISLTLNPDGSAVMFNNGAEETSAWYVRDEQAYYGTGDASTDLRLNLDSDGKLVLADTGSSIIFEKDDMPDAVNDAILPYLGTWEGQSMQMGTIRMDLNLIGYILRLEITENDAALTINDTSEILNWYFADDALYIGTDASDRSRSLRLLEDGTMQLNDSGTVYTLTADSEPEDPLSMFTGTWTATQYSFGGKNYPVAGLGIDYSYTLESDFTGCMESNGNTDSILWTLEEDGAHIGDFTLILIEKGKARLAGNDMDLIFEKQ